MAGAVMTTQTVEFLAPTGQTLTAKLFAFGTDTQTASVSATEATNRKGLYTAAFTDVAAGMYRLIAVNASNAPLAAWDVGLVMATAIFQAVEIGSVTIADNQGYILAILAGACADPQTAAETYTITLGASTYTADFTSLTSSGGRGTTTLSKT